MSAAEEALAAALDDLGLAYDREYKFCPTRRWRADFRLGTYLVEVEGRGRHQTYVGYRNDCEKYNQAMAYGYRVLRFPAGDFKPSPSRKVWPGGARDWAAFIYGLVNE
jgi:very-short-patch-repair endonuclease